LKFVVILTDIFHFLPVTDPAGKLVIENSNFATPPYKKERNISQMLVTLTAYPPGTQLNIYLALCSSFSKAPRIYAIKTNVKYSQTKDS
jgi:hypothetical protein